MNYVILYKPSAPLPPEHCWQSRLIRLLPVPAHCTFFSLCSLSITFFRLFFAILSPTLSLCLFNVNLFAWPHDYKIHIKITTPQCHHHDRKSYCSLSGLCLITKQHPGIFFALFAWVEHYTGGSHYFYLDLIYLPFVHWHVWCECGVAALARILK